jgi:Zn-dependent oligopeptidase
MRRSLKQRKRPHRRSYKKQHGGAAFPPMVDFKNLTAEIVMEQLDVRKRAMNAMKDELLKLPLETVTFHNFVWPQIDIFNDNPQALYFVMESHPKEEVRKACKIAGTALTTEWDAICSQLFPQFDHYYKHKYPMEKDSLDQEFKNYMEFRMSHYKDLGTYLSSEEAAEVKRLKEQILINQDAHELAKKAYQPIIILPEAQLEGLPADFLDKKRKEDGIHLTKNDCFGDVLDYCKNGEVRRMAFESWFNIDYPKNLKLAEQTFSLRKKLALLLGYKSYADYAARRYMNKSSDKVNEYLDSLLEKLQPFYIKKWNELKEFASKDGVTDLQIYDTYYYENLKQKEESKIDEQALEAHFPIFTVAEEILNIYKEMLGFDFIKTKELDDILWDANIVVYDVWENKRLIGRLFLDLLPRDGKDSGSMMSTFVGKSYKTLPFLGVCCVYSKPNQCLKLDQIRSLFHELGHAMHNMSLKSYITRRCGFEWEFDFNEVPSQMFEQLAHEPVILRRILQKTTTKSPSELDSIIQQILKVKQATDMTWYTVIERAKLDLMVHSADYSEVFSEEGPRPTDALIIDVNVKTYGKDIVPRFQKTNTVVNRFSEWIHPMLTRYAGGYNTYVTTYGYALDLYKPIHQNVEHLGNIGDYVKSTLLSHGGSLVASKAVELYLQRTATPAEAFAAVFTKTTARRNTRRTRRRSKFRL